MRGCTVLDGLGMLVNQGVIGIRLWSGREPSSQVMRQALEKALLRETVGKHIPNGSSRKLR
ncbi:MAG: hypothetical protein JO114_16880 [Planctomycetaceae bacterium]|nr:hypothetical protein [Planctomycetaceae bacterium]MBV8310626.1 hypothetical protein [Planctomycetaceae bacterium]